MRIGVLGGTFDPPHNGHLAAADACLHVLELDEVLFLPSNANPLKKRDRVTPARQRLEMVRRLIAGHERFAACDIEITRGGNSYAVDTLRELQAARPADYWFIVGSDAARRLPEWKTPDKLLRLCRVAVVTRSTASEAEVLRRIPAEWNETIDFVKMEAVDVSSTEIRNRVSVGREVSFLLPASVKEFVREMKLYV